MFENFNAQAFVPFSSTDTIILALSGGADSVFLGEMLFRNQFTNVVVAHFHHGLRGEDSDIDQKFCSKITHTWKWQFVTEVWDSPESSEGKARNARYEFLGRIRNSQNAKAIFLAHHQNDQAETVFFQFLRGSGLKGLGGMKKWEQERKLFRPLLNIGKQDIVTFLENEKIEFRKDASNADDRKFDRNFLRLNILPLVRERFPHFQSSLVRNAELYQQIQYFIESYISNISQKLILKNQKGEIWFLRSEFLTLPEFLRGEFLRQFFGKTNVSYDQIQKIAEFIHKAKSGKRISLLGVCFQVYGKNVFVL